MLAPTPLLKPGPLDIGGLFAGSFDVLKRQFGLLVLVTVLPGLLILVALAVSGAILWPSLGALFGGATGQTGGPTTGVVAGGVVLFVGVLLGMLAQLKSYGMLSLAAYEIAQGLRPDFRGLLARTRGFLPRMTWLIVIVAVAGPALYLGMIALIVGVFAVALDSDPQGSAAAAFGALGALTALFLVGAVLVVFLGTRLLYTVPAVALEGVGGIAGLGRSWRLTRGAFWRTLGSYSVAYLAVMAVSTAISTLSQVALTPMIAGLPSSSGADPELVLRAFAGFVPALMLSYGLQLVVQVVTFPFLQAYTTFMFIDQVRRSEVPPAPSYGYPGFPAGPYYAPSHQGYPPAPQPSSGQGWPSPGSPVQGWPARGWAPPGPAQPPQAWGDPPAYPPPAGNGPQGQQPPTAPQPPVQ